MSNDSNKIGPIDALLRAAANLTRGIPYLVDDPGDLPATTPLGVISAQKLALEWGRKLAVEIRGATDLLENENAKLQESNQRLKNALQWYADSGDKNAEVARTALYRAERIEGGFTNAD